jgi:hypothetical protein
MERTEACLICGLPEVARLLGVWFVNGDRWPVHLDCWIAAYGSDRLPVRDTRRSA